jgi:hypothetical protein
MITNVTASNNNGILIADINGMLHKFSYIDNRDYICTMLSDLGINVQPELVMDKSAVIFSETDQKKRKLFCNLAVISAILGNVFMTASSIWYNSPDNYYYRSYTSYYYSEYHNMRIPFDSGYWTHYYYGYEMFTTYIAIAAWVIALIFMIIFFVKISHRISVSRTAIRCVNGTGKVTVIPVEQVTGATANAADASVTINSAGIRRRVCLIANHLHIAVTINNYRPNAYAQPYAQPVPQYMPSAQPYAQPTQQYAPAVQPYAQPTPQYAPPAQPYVPQAQPAYNQPTAPAPVDQTPSAAQTANSSFQGNIN